MSTYKTLGSKFRDLTKGRSKTQRTSDILQNFDDEATIPMAKSFDEVPPTQKLDVAETVINDEDTNIIAQLQQTDSFDEQNKILDDAGVFDKTKRQELYNKSKGIGIGATLGGAAALMGGDSAPPSPQDVSVMEEPSKGAPKGAAVSPAKQPKVEDVVDENDVLEVGSGGENDVQADTKEEITLRGALKEYSDAVTKAQLAYQKERDEIKQRKMWADIVQGVAVIAAGLYGLKTGRDMTGVQFNPVDASQHINDAKDALNMSMKTAATKYGIKKDIAREDRLQAQNLTRKALQVAKEQKKVEEASKKLVEKKLKESKKEETKLLKAQNKLEDRMRNLLNKPKMDEAVKKVEIMNEMRATARENKLPFNEDSAKLAIDKIFQEDPDAWFFTGDRSLDEQLQQVSGAVMSAFQTASSENADPVRQYAERYDIPYERAKAILEKRKGGR